MNDILEITSDTFSAKVLHAKGPVLVDFWAEWCNPCKALSPTIEALATEYAGRVTVGKVDLDKCPDIKERYGLMSIPAVFLFVDGEIVEHSIGVKGKEFYSGILDDHLDGGAKTGARVELDLDDHKALKNLLQYGNEDQIREVLKSDPSIATAPLKDPEKPEKPEMTPFWYVVNNVPGRLYLLEDYIDETDVYQCASFGRSEGLAKLVDANPSLATAPSDFRLTAYFLAILNRHLDCVEIVMAAAAKTNGGNLPEKLIRTTVEVMFFMPDLQLQDFTLSVYKQLHKYGAAFPEMRFEADATLLHRAVWSATPNEVLKYLLDEGVDPDAANEEGKVALDYVKNDIERFKNDGNEHGVAVCEQRLKMLTA